ncbi:OsmC family protein [Indioceanicola profundi]|uniref:OsmC family protein n=1 Tax=Indioceanicola profundi TaxID=2220096 RepID=UPI000E6AD8DC|nr:OsmC family protein [Indioceanicola profundi]
MPIRSADAEWTGGVPAGNGRVKLESGALDTQYNFSSRFESGTGTNPEELIAGAHAGCFSMAFSLMLGQEGFTPERVRTTAKVHIDKQGGGFAITRIDLVTRASIPGIGADKFQEVAEKAKANCPVSRALKAVDITLDAALE